jgi:hypothetical protein
MNRNLNERLYLLFAVLAFDSDRTRIFTVGERICINQERGSLCELRSLDSGEASKDQVRFYIVPESIENKIEVCEQMMNRTQWVPPPQQYEWEEKV